MTGSACVADRAAGVKRIREALLRVDEDDIEVTSSRIPRERHGCTSGRSRESGAEENKHKLPLPTPHTLFFKHEGENPTGSFKDRGMTVAMTQAKRLGARAVACASTGNTSASLAAYAAQAGIRAVVFIPAGKVATGKLAQTLAYGATALHVRGVFSDD